MVANRINRVVFAVAMGNGEKGKALITNCADDPLELETSFLFLFLISPCSSKNV